MSILSSTLYFVAGFIIAFIFPRLPGILITRGKGFNTNFPPHPEPIPLSPYLTQRVLHMRMFYWLGLMVSIVPLSFGLVSVRWGNVPFGFGLWILALQKTDLTKIYWITSIYYLLVPLFSLFILKENISNYQFIGYIIITVGASFASIK